MNQIIKLVEAKLASQLDKLQDAEYQRENAIMNLVECQNSITAKEEEVDSLRTELKKLYSKFPEYQEKADTTEKLPNKQQAVKGRPKSFYGGQARKPFDEYLE
jgi:uncharacterized coiled-coil protein SlyX